MPPRLDVPTIVAAALELLDECGIDGVTLRSVASKLGVQAPSLYHHVRNKQALLDEMGTEVHRRVIRRVAAEADAPGRGTGFADDLRVYGCSLRAEYLDHRDGARTFSGTLITDPEALRSQEPWLERWAAQGISSLMASDGLEAVTAFVTGFVIEEQQRADSANDPDRYDPVRRAERVGDAGPRTARAGFERHGPADRFARQLACLLHGLGRTGSAP